MTAKKLKCLVWDQGELEWVPYVLPFGKPYYTPETYEGPGLDVFLHNRGIKTHDLYRYTRYFSKDMVGGDRVVVYLDVKKDASSQAYTLGLEINYGEPQPLIIFNDSTFAHLFFKFLYLNIGLQPTWGLSVDLMKDYLISASSRIEV